MSEQAVTKNDAALEWAREELQHLWNDLAEADRVAYSKPSLGMLSIMERIKSATALVGPVHWKHVSIRWIYSGEYKQWADYMGIECHFPTEEEYPRLYTGPLPGETEWPKWTTGKWVDKP